MRPFGAVGARAWVSKGERGTCDGVKWRGQMWTGREWDDNMER